MNEFFYRLEKSIKHLQAFHKFFNKQTNYLIPSEKNDLELYQSNLKGLVRSFSEISAFEQLYNENSRQLILAEDKTAIKTHYPFYSGLEGLSQYGLNTAPNPPN